MNVEFKSRSYFSVTYGLLILMFQLICYSINSYVKKLVPHQDICRKTFETHKSKAQKIKSRQKKLHRDKKKENIIKIDDKRIKITNHSLFRKQNYNFLKKNSNSLNIILIPIKINRP